MKKKKYKLKKQVWYFIVIIIFVPISIISIVKVKKNYELKQTIEYKLQELGYSDNDVSLLKKYLSKKELNQLLNDKKNEVLIKLMNTNNYKHSNLERYQNYLKSKQNNYEEAIKVVNINRDYDFYEKILEADTSKGNLILVNKYYKLPSDYVPENLVTISSKYSWGEGKQIKKEVYDAFINMWNDAKKQDIYLVINLGYRSYEQQDNIYNKYKESNNEKYADIITLRPGHSEHQTGLALDILEKSHSDYSTYDQTDAALWLKENAYKYGFILRFSEENEGITGLTFEPWHYRYVGKSTAQDIFSKQLTFEEYYANYIEK